MDYTIENPVWDAMSRREKNQQLYLSQKRMLDMFLQLGAISQEQHDLTVHFLTVRMAETA